MPRYRDEDRQRIKQETRSKLLAAAAAVFARDGYEKANVNQIAADAGFAIGTLYNHFPSKRNLMSELLAAAAQAHSELIASRVLGAGGPEQRIDAFYQAGFEFIVEAAQSARLVLSMLNGPDEAFKAQLFQDYQPLFNLIAEEILLPGIAGGQFRPVEPTATAMLLMVIYLGAGSQTDPAGLPYLEALAVADFVKHALRRP